MSTSPHLLLISGSTRSGSTNTSALRTIAADAPKGIRTTLYEGILDIPPFIPGDEPAPGAVEALRKQIDDADAVLFCTPEYAGMIPGSLKNLLEWTVGTGNLSDKPVAWINVAFDGRGEAAVATLRTVLGYVGASIVESVSGRITVLQKGIGADGLVADPATRERLTAVAIALAERVRK
ncbi:NADPH-dependent FMN reductase [Nocardia huaxiensis]|uniref:NAD(P)H-dependent oxidoreductase n=1 Tax=Nocardia huaxiensis TaxID=2755382 RepID=A0A7D6ZPM6_9NOCA|nr:NADPH-dependent FMN reductase [Nocardia huaxiensis]QLY30585.1 NAD(P)H-dependent oxidoreductase [Nocardia huaxiensis]UFS95812.1 NAD(P)H-dependent oxidoreductase [Nocardia huaxiensis]